MNKLSTKWRELDKLIDLVLDGLHTPNNSRRINEILRTDMEACRHYVAYMKLHGRLTWGDGIKADPERNIADLDISDPPLVVPPLSPLLSPPSSPFVGGPVFSYMVATLVLCVMILGAWAYKITRDAPIATNAPAPSLIEKDALRSVARITGVKDCQWPADAIVPMVGSYVSLGRKYSLDAGLLEISYESGARVILEGPCDYTVDSDASGRLQRGKLVARVEKKVASAKPQAANPQSPVPSPQPPAPSLSTLHSPLFTISTPTAIVTDLGTEFGVEVDEAGNTTSYVFRGSVKIHAFTDEADNEVVLKANQFARVLKGDKPGESRLMTGAEAGDSPKFVRRIHQPPRHLDLLDIVAGGDGYGVRRERGIDPATGCEDPVLYLPVRSGEPGYHSVGWHRLIDGVFVPNGDAGAVQLDSAGHAYDRFPATSGKLWGSIWPRTTEVDRNDSSKNWEKAGAVYALHDAERYMPLRRGLLFIHANAGITFDLESIHNLNRDSRPTRLQATVGLLDDIEFAAQALGLVDIWIFVDGRLEFSRKHLRPSDGTFELDVKLESADRFLTIVATDGGNQFTQDLVIFGDPVLLMTSTEENVSSDDEPTKQTFHTTEKHQENQSMEK